MYEYPNHAKRRRRSAPAKTVRLRTVRRDRATVVTMIEPALRNSIDGATENSFSNVHVGSVREAAQAVQSHAARAILVSPTIVRNEPLTDLARLVLKSPGVTPVAVIGTSEPVSATELLDLGACGVRQIVDLNARCGWDQLRGILDNTGGEAAVRILASLLPLLEDATDETKHFFATLVRVAPSFGTVRKVATVFRVSPSTLMSRFFRAKLPAPKAYLAMTRLLYAAAFFETQALSIVDVANALEFSSPQSFGRHIRMLLGLSAGEFRREVSLDVGLHHFADKLVLPFRETFRTFTPIGAMHLRPMNGMPHHTLAAAS